MAKTRTARELLKGIGIGDFNATMLLQNIFFAPATTSPTSSTVPCTDRTSGGTS